jgi:DNA-binding MarR family transcriptional regulator
VTIDVPTWDSSLGDLACELYSEREKRDRFFEEPPLSDAAWDMLLMLRCAQRSGAPLTVSSLATAGNSPQTTGLRWMGVLEERALIRRFPHPSDGRSSLVELTASAQISMDKYLTKIRFDRSASRLRSIE